MSEIVFGLPLLEALAFSHQYQTVSSAANDYHSDSENFAQVFQK